MMATMEVCVFCVPLSYCYPRLSAHSSIYFVCAALSGIDFFFRVATVSIADSTAYCENIATVFVLYKLALNFCIPICEDNLSKVSHH